MTRVEDEHFDTTTVLLDGHSFVRCKLTNCKLRYSGGPFTMNDTEVENCHWAFGGPARRTMEVLAKFNVFEEDPLRENVGPCTSLHAALVN